MVLSLLFKASHKELRMLMIDPKMLELSVYQGIPHFAGARGHRHEGGRQRPALVRGRNGASLQTDERGGRA